ncbi:MAG: protein phosphatase 2C domain-containing protein [Longispora sp.]|nr:protein phosphatase 2C domain-containing protein [Longispora sp. (in: high G+C Gram-positive bacteria)]
MTLTLRYAARSDRGLIRSGNEDSMYAGPRLLAVADGMGGMAAGDVASNIVIATLAPLDEDVPGSDLIEPLHDAVDLANQRLRAIVEENPQFEGMGTTLTGLLFSGSRFGMVHVGDSRAYLLRGDDFAQITKDDTYVQMLVDEGRITEEEANSHPQRSLITQAMGTTEVHPEYSILEAVSDDRILLCSDGLSGFVSFDTIGETLRTVADPAECVERLIQLALRAGGPDNVTVVVADVTDSDIVEGVPIVGGAAATDRGENQPVDLSSSAGRAAALKQPLQVTQADTETTVETHVPRVTRRRTPLRVLMLGVLAFILLAGGGFGAWFYSQSQYYVGATGDGRVAVFQGLPGTVAGFTLSSVNIASPRPVDDLTPLAQGKVRKGIQVSDLSKAKVLMVSLTEERADNTNLLPVCASTDPEIVATPTVIANPTVNPSAGQPAAPPSAQASTTPTVQSTPTGITEAPPSCRPRK